MKQSNNRDKDLFVYYTFVYDCYSFVRVCTRINVIFTANYA